MTVLKRIKEIETMTETLWHINHETMKDNNYRSKKNYDKKRYTNNGQYSKNIAEKERRDKIGKIAIRKNLKVTCYRCNERVHYADNC
jgi:hypothetical protein